VLLPPSARSALPVVAALAVALLGAPTASSRPGADRGGSDDRARVSRLAEVNGVGVDQMRRLLRDPTVHLTDEGYAYVVDPAAPRGATRPAPARARQVAPLKRTFRLHSNPGAKRTIFLDFDGATVRGTSWNRFGVRNGFHPGWDPANNGPKFNAREKRIVQSVWARVAEDYAPFAVDVTTQQPRDARIHRNGRRDKVFGTRVLITESRQAFTVICNRACGGVSFIGSFDRKGKVHRRQQPAWVFPAGLRNGTKAVAEAASHEAGHTLGLEHDGGLSTSYYQGHGAWAPIMGASYFRPITQWSNGSYAFATTHQDDVRVISRNGAPFRRDEAGGTPKKAKRGLPRGTAYISRRTDVDVYRLGRCRGKIKVRAANAPISPNLDIRLALIRKGRVIATADPRSRRISNDRAGGMDATLRRRVGKDVYFVAVDGVGRGDPDTSYDDYGSLGAYRLTVKGC